jgi:hypothetical protein
MMGLYSMSGYTGEKCDKGTIYISPWQTTYLLSTRPIEEELIISFYREINTFKKLGVVLRII